MDTLWQDLKFGMRMLGRKPAFTAIAILTLALGIGANTAIFTVVDAVLLRPLPYPQSNRIVFLGETSRGVPDMSLSMADLRDWETLNTVFESMVAYRADAAILTGTGDAELLQMREVTAGLFPTLGVKPILGRALTADDDKVGAEPVVLLSDGFWTRKFGRDPAVLGRRLTLDGVVYTVIGVLPSSQFHASWRQYSVFSSLGRLEDMLGGPTRRDDHPGIYAYARLKPGVTMERARAEMTNIAARLAKQYPQTNSGHGATVDSLLHAIVGDVQSGLVILLAAVGFVLLIACANVANLMLARASERQREMAVRIALGAGRGRLVRQLLTESVLLAVGGGALGLLVAYWVTGSLAGMATTINVPRIDSVTVDRWVLAYTAALSLLVGLLFGIIPAWQASRTDIHEAIKEGARGDTSSGGRKRVRQMLVVAEVAVSVLLLIGAGLTIKSLYRVLRADPGFDPGGVLTAEFSLPDAQYKNEAKQRQFVNRLVEIMAAEPGVQSAGLENPLLGGHQTSYVIEGRPMPKPEDLPDTDITIITPDSLRAMGRRLVAGRYFSDHDDEKSERVCIVDTLMAQINWPGQNPLGNRLAISGTPEAPEWRSVVGVTAHVKNYGVDQPSREELILPFAQQPNEGGNLVVRTSGNPASLAPALRSALKTLDPNIPLSNVQSLTDILDGNVAPRRFSVILLSAFAGLALLLAMIGIYGVMSYVVAQRTREIGIRMALGAHPRDVFAPILRSGMGLFAVGLAAGTAGALFLDRFLESMLFQVKATDPEVFLSIPGFLAAVALVACYLPARRATRVDPLVALRYE